MSVKPKVAVPKPVKPRKKRGGPGALIILSLFLASSGALRLGAEAGTALAAAETETGDHAASEAPANCPPTPVALAAALSEREAELTNREAALEERLAALALAQEAIDTRMAELTAAEEELKNTLTLADGAADEDVARLVAVYEAMKPKDAAKLFETMQPEFAAGFLARMSPESAASIMAGLSSGVAYEISALIAGRNALVPKN